MHLPDTRPIYISSRLSTTTPDGRPAAASVGSPHGDAQGRAARRGRTSPSWRRKVRKFGGRALHYPPRPRFFVIHARADITATLFGRVRARTPQRRRRAAYDSRIRPASARAPIWTTQGPVGIESIIKGF